MNNLKDIHNAIDKKQYRVELFYQDFNEQFEEYTQPGIISYDIADYGMHLSHKRLFRQFLR